MRKTESRTKKGRERSPDRKEGEEKETERTRSEKTSCLDGCLSPRLLRRRGSQYCVDDPH